MGSFLFGTPLVSHRCPFVAGRKDLRFLTSLNKGGKMSGFRASRDRVPRDEHRRDDRYGVSSQTNSTNPTLLDARVFVGNVHSENTSREDMHDRFNKYGKILGISLHRGFSFVQYKNEEDAVVAVRKEHGTTFKGAVIDVNLAKERRRDGGDRGPGNANNPLSRRSPSMEDDLPKERRWSYRQNQTQREPVRDRSPLQIENPFLDGYRDGRSNDNKYGPRGGGAAGGVPYRDDAREMFAARKANEIPAMMNRHTDETIRPRNEPGGGFDRTVPYEKEFGKSRSRTSSGGSAGLRAVAAATGAPNKQPNDCEIIALTKHQRVYAELVERRLRNMGLKVDLLFPHEGSAVTVSKILENISNSGCLYAIVVSPQHEIHNSLTLHILHGTPEEHRNMPLDDAMMLLDRNFDNFMKSRKTLQLEQQLNTRPQQTQQPPPRLQNALQQQPQLQHIPVQQQPEQRMPSRGNLDYYDPLQQHQVQQQQHHQQMQQHNVPNHQLQSLPQEPIEPKIQTLFTLLAGNQPLSIAELDLVIGHLQEQRARLLGRDSSSGLVASENFAKPEKTKSGELPPHILELISTNSNPTSKEPANQMSSLTKPNTNTQTFINFSNPSVQKALDSLMQSGSANILRSLEAVGGNSGTNEAGGSNGGVAAARPAQQQPVTTHRHPLLGVPTSRRGIFGQRM